MLRLSCRQMSRILLGIFCVFLHACIGSSKMLLPSALKKKLVLKLGCLLNQQITSALHQPTGHEVLSSRKLSLLISD